MLIPVKAFADAKGRLSVAARPRPARRAGPLARRSGGRRGRRRCRCSSPATTTRSPAGPRRHGAERAVEPGARSQRCGRRRPGDDRRQGVRPRRRRPQRPAAGPRPRRPRPPSTRHARARPPRRRHERDRLSGRRRAIVAGLRRGVVPPPPRRRRSPTGCRVEVRADPELALDIDTPADLAHPLAANVAAGMAANEPGQPPLSATSPRRDGTVDLDVPASRAGDRRPSRRRRVRRRRHAGQVGGRRLRRAPPRVHRRLEGHVGRRRRHRRARRPPPGRAARGGPTRCRRTHDRRRSSFLGRVDGELDSDRRHASPRSPASSARCGPTSCSATTRGSATGCTPTTATPACSSATRSSPPAIRTSSASTASPTTGRRRCCCGRPTRPNHVEDVTAQRRRQARRAARPTRASSSRRCTPRRRPGELDAFRRADPHPARRARRAVRACARRGVRAHGRSVGRNCPASRALRRAGRRTPGRCAIHSRRRGRRRRQVDVVEVAALGDHQAEVERRSGHPIVGVRRPPLPHLARAASRGATCTSPSGGSGPLMA